MYDGYLGKFPFGALIQKRLTIKSGQTHVNRYIEDLLHRIEEGRSI